MSRRQTIRIQRAVVLGGGAVAERIVRKLRAHPEYGVDVIGLILNAHDMRRTAGSTRVLGTPDQLPTIIKNLDIDQ